MGAGRFFSDPGKGLVKLEFGSLFSLTDSVRCGSSMEMCHKESTVQKVDVTDCLKSCSWNFLKESKLLYSLRSSGAAGCFRLQLAACWLRLAAFGCCSAASN